MRRVKSPGRFVRRCLNGHYEYLNLDVLAFLHLELPHDKGSKRIDLPPYLEVAYEEAGGQLMLFK